MKLFPGQSLEDVADDEPVFVVRAADAEAPAIIRKAAFLYRARHGATKLADNLEAFADEVFAWQHADGNAAPPPERDDLPVAEPAAAEEAPADPPERQGGTGPERATRKERRR